jgi:hypothetical protein
MGKGLRRALLGEILMHELRRTISGKLRLVEPEPAGLREGLISNLILALVVWTGYGSD